MFEDPSPLFCEPEEAQPRPRFAVQLLEDACVAIETITDAPDLLALQSIMSVASLVTQGHVDVKTLGGTAPVSLFTVSIARSGERKSYCDKLATRELVAFQTARLRKYRSELAAFEQRANASSQDDVLEDINPDAAPTSETRPLDPHLLYADVTIEGVLTHFEWGNPSIGLRSDEGGQFFSSHSMKRENKLRTASVLSNLWGGTPVDRLRASSSSETFFGRRLSVSFMLQPGIANSVLTDPTLNDQGLNNRMLVVWPRSRIGTRTIDNYKVKQERDAKAAAKLDAFHDKVRDILAAPLPCTDKDGLILKPKVLALSEEAQELLVDFYNRTEIAQVVDGVLEHIEGFASKVAEQACRIAGIFTAFDDLTAREVSATYISNAIEFAEYYLEEMRRLRSCGMVSAQHREAERLRKWLRKHRPGQLVSCRDIQRNGPKPRHAAEQARALMAILCDHGCARAVSDPDRKKGSGAQKDWLVL